MGLAQPVLKLNGDRVAWEKVDGAHGFTLREITGPGAPVIVALGPADLSYPAKPGAIYTVEARGKRSAPLTVPAAPAPADKKLQVVATASSSLALSVPAGANVKWHANVTASGDDGPAEYPVLAASQPFTPPADAPFASAIPCDANGVDLPGWTWSDRAKTAPAPTNPPSPPSTPPTGKRVGVGVRVSLDNDRAALTTLKAINSGIPVRCEIRANDPASADYLIDGYVAMGVVPQPCANWSGGNLPSDSQIDALAAWARSKAGKIRLVELGNEDSYGYKTGDNWSTDSYKSRARTYAAKAARLAKALAGSGVGVLVQAEDGDSGSSNWVDNMYAAVPDLHKWAAGWVVHPYGPDFASRIARMYSQLDAHGWGNLLAYCTEGGVSTDDGRALSDNYGWPTNLTYAQAADVLRGYVNGLLSIGKVAQVMLYQSSDQSEHGADSDREHYFGLVRLDGTAKAAFTQAASELLAAG